VAYKFNVMRSRPKVARTYNRGSFTENAKENFKIALANTVWDDVYAETINGNGPSDAYTTFYEIYLHLFDTHFPLQEFKFTKRMTPRTDWITPGLIKSCNKKSSLYKK